MIELFRLQHVAHLPAGTPVVRPAEADRHRDGVHAGAAARAARRAVRGRQPEPRRPAARAAGRAQQDAGRQLRRHRAQHGLHHAAVPARDLHGRRQGAGGRPAGGRCRRTGRCSKRISATERHEQTTTMADDSIIEFDKVVAGYSPSLTILNETTLDARKGEITLLIGPNGAGKSTVLKTLFGMLTPRSRRSPLRGQAHQRQVAARTARRGHRVRAAGAQPVRLAVGAAQPRARRHHAAARRAAGPHRRGAGALSAHPRAHRQPGVDDVGRRAEAARDRPRAAAAPARAADRRAVDRPVAEARAGSDGAAARSSPTAARRC